ncbi:Low-density lipoprotein receptor class A domain-containing protein 4 [Liparis tanakae]|uniref:Low-density lipoprotein receptor class A domain-containing protein 4 n=1 Tax=Liparis tanakae TaxID=230148 RepID=A0A4Z2E9P2_9TELE|nr:Low-density lipoprotein receptor class A domain-containing protein 4 [Liparis tanakae]
MQRDRFSRFQPTYPYLQHQIDLPPTISLSDGEEPPPYQGPCTLQLRDPEQQMELNRESVRAPPNRTIYDSDLIDMGGGGCLSGVGGGGGGGGGGGMGMMGGGGGPRPPSSNSGISAANSSNHGRMEGPPPAYSEVMGHYPGSAFFLHQHSNNQRVGVGVGGRTIQQQSQSESTIVPAKAKDGQPEDLV